MSALDKESINSHIKLLNEIKSISETLKERTKRLSEKRIEQSDFKTDKGVSFLEVKNHVLLNYCSYVIVYILLKVEGKLTEGHSIFEKLVYTRTLFEKMKPLGDKLKYQIDKLLQSIVSLGGGGEGDNLNFKPNIDSLLDDDDEDEEEESKPQSSEIYKAPRLSSTPYEVFEQSIKEKEKKSAKLQAILSKSQILREEQMEQSSRPKMVKEVTPVQEALAAEDREIKLHEEKNFTRLTLTKKDKQRRENLRKQARSATAFSNLESFADIEAVFSKQGKDEDDDDTNGMEWGGKRSKSLAEYEKKHNSFSKVMTHERHEGSNKRKRSTTNIDGDDGKDIGVVKSQSKKFKSSKSNKM